MKRTVGSLILIILIGIGIWNPFHSDPKDQLRDLINSHPFTRSENLTPEDLKAIPKKDRPDLAWEQDFLATMDPSLGRPAPERLIPIYQIVDQQMNQIQAVPGSMGTPWVERGPTNVGGRVRAIMYDPNDSTGKKVWAGGVTGGLWYNLDVSDPNSQWVSVGDLWDNIAVTAIVHDPTDPSTFYVGTGEGWRQSFSGARGGGVWKSTDAGQSWTHLSSTSGFFYVNDMVVRDENGTGVLYVGIRGNYYNTQWHGQAQEGLQRSSNGGSTFTQVLPNIPGQSHNYAVGDLEIGADNRIWLGTVNTGKSVSDKGGGRILYSDNGTSWTVARIVSGGDRVELACAPTDSNYVYALVEIGLQVGALLKSTNRGSTWSSMAHPNDADPGIPSTDFSRGQAWYDLIIQVSPTDKNTLLTGAIDLFKSTNAGTSWTQVSIWTRNSGYPYVHADQHAIVFKPGSGSEVLFGNDGGVYRSTDVNTGSVTFSNLNRGLNITQFYGCALHPNSGSNYMLAGAQDNGTQKFNGGPGLVSTTEATGGDGAYCFIDQTDPNIQITSYVYNSYWRSTNGGASFPNPRMQSSNTGRFINPADYDDHQDALYSARTSTTVNRIRNVSGTPTVDFITITGMSSMASHLRVSPYTTSSTTLFVGTGSGDLYKVTGADGNSPVTTSIGSSLPAGYVSCVELGASENEILVTLMNYGVNSVWYTSNGGTTWVSKEGNLPDMPIRWALFNPNNRLEVILATEVGIWSTTNLSASSPSWSPSISGLANVRVDLLQIRDSDDVVIAATHGRGLFSSEGFALQSTPTANFGASSTSPCSGETVTLVDSSQGTPTSRTWTILPNTYTFVNGTNANSIHPEVQFNSSGSYSIALSVSNSQGSDSLYRSQYIRVGGALLPLIEDFEGAAPGWTVDNPDNSTTWSLYSVSGNSPGSQAAGLINYYYNAVGQRDGLISPALDLSNYNSVNLTFDYAYRRFSSNNQDSLAVYVSIDCGSTWTRVASYKENGSGNFATGNDLTSYFTPSSSADWCGTSPVCPSIDLTAFGGNANVKVKFENINGYGNNLYLDNINISGVLGSAPVADFTADKTQACAGDTIQFTDQSTNSPSSWSWSFSPGTVTYVGGTSASSQNPKVVFTASGNYQVNLTATNASGSDMESKAGYVSVSSTVIPTVLISASDTTICSGTLVSFTATPTNGGNSPGYQWKVNGMNTGSNSPSFSSSTLTNGDVVTVEMTSNATCAAPLSVTSPGITMIVTSPATPTASIQSSSSTICSGQSATFTSTITNGGVNPIYQWKVNGVNAGTNSSSFVSSSLSNGDIVSLQLTSSASCLTTSVVNSNSINMTVNPPLTPTVTISSSSTSICSGQTATFTASPVNGGSSPSYQWKVNGINVGSNSPSYSSQSLVNGDVVSVTLTSNLSCVTSTTANSNTLVMSVQTTPSVSISTIAPSILCKGDTLGLLASPSGGTFYGSGGISGTQFIASLAGSGTHWIYYQYATGNGCVGRDSLSVTVEIVPKPTISVNGPQLACNEPGYSYQWLDSNGPISGATGITYTPFTNGTFRVQISRNGCNDISDLIVLTNVHLPEWPAISGATLFPNPNQGRVVLRIQALRVEKVSLELLDAAGRLMWRSELEVRSGAGDYPLDLGQGLSSGIYSLRVTGESGFTILKTEIQ